MRAERVERRRCPTCGEKFMEMTYGDTVIGYGCARCFERFSEEKPPDGGTTHIDVSLEH